MRAALHRLREGLPTQPDLQDCNYELSVTNLHRKTGIGRNTIYRPSQRGILDRLSNAQEAWKHTCPPPRTVSDKIRELRGIITTFLPTPGIRLPRMHPSLNARPGTRPHSTPQDEELMHCSATGDRIDVFLCPQSTAPHIAPGEVT